MPNKKMVDKFAAAIERAFSTKTELIADQVDFDDKYQHLFKEDYATAIQLIVSVSDADTLSGMMKSYLALFFKYYANKNNIHFARSDQTYLELYKQSPVVSSPKNDLFALWARLIVPDADNSFKKRYLELSRTVASQITTFIEEQKKKRRESTSILTLLKDEYLKQKGRQAKTHEELYDFDPAPWESLRVELEQKVDHVKAAWTICVKDNTPEHRKAFHVTLDEYRLYLLKVSRWGHLQLFQLIKHLQQPLRIRKEKMRSGPGVQLFGERSELLCELYVLACLELAIHASAKALKPNRFGLTKEEQDYFLHFLREAGYEFVSNLEARMALRVDDVPALMQQSKAFLDLILLTRNQIANTTLVNLKDTLRLQKMWQDIHELKAKFDRANKQGQEALLSDPKNAGTWKSLLEILQTEVPIGEPGPNLGKGTMQATLSPGTHEVFGSLTIVYIDPRNKNDFYIEYFDLKPNLFLVHTNYITNKLYGERISSVYKSTIGIVYLTELMFKVIGFLPVFIHTGFAGLAYEIIVYYGSMKLEEQVSKINPILGKIVGLAAMLVTPRPNFGPKLKGVDAASMEAAGTLSRVEMASQNVRFLNIEDAGTRSFAEILAAHKTTGKMTADFNRGALARAAVKLSDKIKDKFMAMQKVELATLFQEITVNSAALATNGPMLRVAQIPRGTGARGLGGSVSRAQSTLQRSHLLKQLKDYYRYLTRDELLLVEQQVNTILQSLKKGTLKYSEASQEVLNLLNGVKEKTGEYVCDFFVLSEFEILEVVSIPRRGISGAGAPVLDRVYKVKDRQTNQIEHLVVEVKGGERTRLGWVTKKSYEYKNGKMTITTLKGEVQQASGEWYYQKIIELYETGNQTLARRLFEAAKLGKVQSMIIKSGKELDPKITFNTAEVKNWFSGKKLPYD